MRYTGEVLMPNELYLPHKNSKCIFCDGRHRGDKCRNLPDVLSRNRRLKKRCFISLKKDHLEKEWKLHNKICLHCGEKKKHHRSLCPNKFEITKTPAIEKNENYKKITSHEHNLVAVGKNVHQRMYINKELADNLQLKTRETQKYSVYTFRNKKPRKIVTSLVELTIKTQKGDDILIKTSTVPLITGLIQRVPINIPEHLADTLF